MKLFDSVPVGTELTALKETLESGWWGNGKKTKEFEEKFAEYVGAKYAVGMNSCSSALDVAARFLEKDEITVSPLTFVASALCILHAGKKVKFVDIDEGSLCTPEADIQVLYAGNDYGLGTIYDMAHAGGMKHQGLISCWSFQAVKNLPVGDGGMLTTNDEAIAKRARALSWCGIEQGTWERSSGPYKWGYDINEIGFKGNMNDITATIGLCQLEKLAEHNGKRAQIASWYDSYLKSSIIRPYPSETWHLYVIRSQNRDKTRESLTKAGIASSIHYKPLYNYPIFPQTPLPNTEAAYKEILSLPMHLNLTEEDVKIVCDVVNHEN